MEYRTCLLIWPSFCSMDCASLLPMFQAWFTQRFCSFRWRFVTMANPMIFFSCWIGLRCNSPYLVRPLLRMLEFFSHWYVLCHAERKFVAQPMQVWFTQSIQSTVPILMLFSSFGHYRGWYVYFRVIWTASEFFQKKSLALVWSVGYWTLF